MIGCIETQKTFISEREDMNHQHIVRHPRLNATYFGLNHIAPSHFVNKSERRVDMPELSPLPQELIAKKVEILPLNTDSFEARELGTKAWL